jgi:Rha family phage regulatory protein
MIEERRNKMTDTLRNYKKGNKLVEADKNNVITTSRIIAEKFEKRHQHVLEAIRNLECSEQFRRSNFRQSSYVNSQNKQQPMYEITRDGFAFLAMGFTGKKAAQWKEKFIEAFNKMERALIKMEMRILKMQAETSWQEARLTGKIKRRDLTDKLKAFIAYAEEQGSKGTASHAYSNFTRLINKACGIPAAQRDNLTRLMLHRIGAMESIIEMKVEELMKKKMYCKDIYAEVRDVTIPAFVALMPWDDEEPKFLEDPVEHALKIEDVPTKEQLDDK